MNEPTLTIYTTAWCPDSHRAKAFLTRHNVPFREIDIDRDWKAEKVVRRLNRGPRLVPTLVFPDGLLLAAPSDDELAARFGIHIEGEATT